MSEELKANSALLTEAIDALTSCDDVDYRIDMMLAYRPEIVSTLRALLSALTASQARAEAAEARVGELEAAANMIASFDRIKDDPMETLRAIFAHLAEDEAVVERIKQVVAEGMYYGLPQVDPKLVPDTLAGDIADVIVRTLAGKE